LIRLSLACDWRFGNYVSLSAFGDYSGISVKSLRGFTTDFSGGGTFLGGQFQAVLYQPGVDFPNQLVAFWTGMGYVPNFGLANRLVNWNELSMATNTFRRLFYRATVATASELRNSFPSGIRESANLSLDLPVSLRIPLSADHSLYLAAIMPSAGIVHSAVSSGNAASAAAYASFRPGDPRPGTRPQAFASAASLPSENEKADLVFSTTLKLVSPLKSLVFWDFYYALPIQETSRDGYFGISLSL
jgi:hypothetical protein